MDASSMCVDVRNKLAFSMNRWKLNKLIFLSFPFSSNIRKPMKLALIGGGNMGGALLKALVKSNTLAASDTLLIEPDSGKRENLVRETGCRAKASIDDEIAGGRLPAVGRQAAVSHCRDAHSQAPAEGKSDADLGDGRSIDAKPGRRIGTEETGAGDAEHSSTGGRRNECFFRIERGQR